MHDIELIANAGNVLPEATKLSDMEKKWVDPMINIPLIWSFVDKPQIHKNDSSISSALGHWNCIICCKDGIIFCIWKIWLA